MTALHSYLVVYKIGSVKYSIRIEVGPVKAHSVFWYFVSIKENLGFLVRAIEGSYCYYYYY